MNFNDQDLEKALEAKESLLSDSSLSFLDADHHEEFGIYVVNHSRMNFWGAGINDEDFIW